MCVCSKADQLLNRVTLANAAKGGGVEGSYDFNRVDFLNNLPWVRAKSRLAVGCKYFNISTSRVLTVSRMALRSRCDSLSILKKEFSATKVTHLL